MTTDNLPYPATYYIAAIMPIIPIELQPFREWYVPCSHKNRIQNSYN